MAAKRLLKLVFAVDGEPYHESTLAPRVAKDMLGKKAWSKLFLDHVECPWTCFSYAAISRCNRAAVVKFLGNDSTQHECIITLNTD